LVHGRLLYRKSAKAWVQDEDRPQPGPSRPC
jgi:hypothetical protein